MPVSALQSGVGPSDDDSANFEGGTSFFKTEGGVPLTSGQIKEGPDSRWSRGEFRNSDENAKFDENITGKNMGAGQSPIVGKKVTIDINKLSGGTMG